MLTGPVVTSLDQSCCHRTAIVGGLALVYCFLMTAAFYKQIVPEDFADCEDQNIKDN